MSASEDVIEYVRIEIEKKNKIIEEKSKNLEVLNKSCISKDKRYFQIKTVESSSSKLTINPCSGRFTLKISHKSSDEVKKSFIKICNIAMQDEFEPVTLRGKFRFKDDKHIIILQSNSRRFTKYYELEKEI